MAMVFEEALARTTTAWENRLKAAKASKKRWRSVKGSRPVRELFRTRPDIITRNDLGRWGLELPGGGWKEIVAVHDLCRVIADAWENHEGRRSGKASFLKDFMNKYLAANRIDLEFILDTFVYESYNREKSEDTRMVATLSVTHDLRAEQSVLESTNFQLLDTAVEDSGRHSIPWLPCPPLSCNSDENLLAQSLLDVDIPHEDDGAGSASSSPIRTTEYANAFKDLLAQHELQERMRSYQQLKAKIHHTLAATENLNMENHACTRQEASEISAREYSPPVLYDSTLSNGRGHEQIGSKSLIDQQVMLPNSAISSRCQLEMPWTLPESQRQRRINSHISPLPRTLQHRPTQLCDAYFKRTCALLSNFDSPLNPFRSIISSQMAESSTIYLLVQALAAAHANTYSALTQEALNLQAEAFVAVRQDILKASNIEFQIKNVLMLSVTLLGSTTSWFNTADTGIVHFDGAWELLTHWLTGKAVQLDFESSFALGFFVYWQMTAAFVTNVPEVHLARQNYLHTILRKEKLFRDPQRDGEPCTRFLVPHPSTGFSAELYLCIGKIGSLGRIRTLGEEKFDVSHFTNSHMQQARALETYLLGWEGPHIDTTNDIMDEETPVSHILTLMEAYRCAGILQLYTIVPELLQKRLPLDMLSFLGVNTQNCADEEFARDYSMRSGCPSSRFTATRHRLLQAIAFRGLELLRELPITSGTRTTQPILLLITGSWVVQEKLTSTHAEANLHVPVAEDTDANEDEDENPIAYWRNFIRMRFEANRPFLGVAPYSRIQQILEGTWKAADQHNRDCCWMSFMARMGWETLLG